MTGGGHRGVPEIHGLTRRIDILAELLSCEFSMRDAREYMGIPAKHVDVTFFRLRKELGWQAV